ncbi:MAG: hypothetical protein V2I33_22085, partial [Kangiellaceae bacterium]|nr:hypothetical protein [Kangiellaceae bacterium]
MLYITYSGASPTKLVTYFQENAETIAAEVVTGFDGELKITVTTIQVLNKSEADRLVVQPVNLVLDITNNAELEFYIAHVCLDRGIAYLSYRRDYSNDQKEHAH